MARSLLAWSRAAAALALIASAFAQEPARTTPVPTQASSERELEVLRLLRRALADEPLQRHYEGPLPQRLRATMAVCGNDSGLPEPLNLRVESLFRAYGLDVVRDMPVTAPGVAAQLDGRDPQRRLGWKLLSPVQSDQQKALAPEEIEPLHSAGETVFLAATPHSADSQMRLLLAAVDWLDANTEGPDVGTAALSRRRVRSAQVPMPPGATVVAAEDAYGVVTIRVTEETKWRIPSNQLVWQEPATPRATAAPPTQTPPTTTSSAAATNAPAANAPAPPAGPPVVNRETPTLVQLELADLDHATLVCRLQQDDPSAGVHEHGCGNRATFVMPSSFDRSHAFWIEVRLLPGTYAWRPWLHVGLP